MEHGGRESLPIRFLFWKKDKRKKLYHVPQDGSGKLKIFHRTENSDRRDYVAMRASLSETIDRVFLGSVSNGGGALHAGQHAPLVVNY